MTASSNNMLVERLRWVMISVMAFSIANTLIGQPESYWHDPNTAIRSDGLSIYTNTNPVFDFFLGHGWLPYVGTSLAYVGLAFTIVSVLPRTFALIMTFTLMMMHFFDGCNWLVVRWHTGIQGAILYCIVLASGLAFMTLSATRSARPTIKILRWIMVAAQAADMVVTLVGQPASYWHNPQTVHEGNALSYFFLSHGFEYYCLYQLAYYALGIWLLGTLPEWLALIWAFSAIFGGFVGGSNWFFYEWRMGIQPLFIYATILSILISLFGFSPRLAERRSKSLIGTLICNRC